MHRVSRAPCFRIINGKDLEICLVVFRPIMMSRVYQIRYLPRLLEMRLDNYNIASHTKKLEIHIVYPPWQ